MALELPGRQGFDPTAPDLREKARTDLGNSMRWVAKFGDTFKFNKSWEWCAWDGLRWVVERTDLALDLAKDLVLEIGQEAQQALDDPPPDLLGSLQKAQRKAWDDEWKAALAWAEKSQSKARLHAMVDLAASHSAIASVPEQFDADPYLLNCTNGIVDLRADKPLMTMRRGRPTDLFTKVTGVPVNHTVDTTLWETFLDAVFQGDRELIDWVQMALGTCLCGDVMERLVFICYGTGANGKSTLFNILAAVLGDYHVTAEIETFLNTDRSGAGPSGDVARLRGARMVTAMEPDASRRLDEARIKRLSGGDPITASFKYKDHFTFSPTFKIWLAANHKPVIRGRDHGIWSRIRLIPFERKFLRHEQEKDLAQRIVAREGPGILAWLVQGFQAWQRGGSLASATPTAVLTATAAYQVEMDPLADFFAAHVVVDPTTYEAASTLYKRYQDWCYEAGVRYVISAKAFGQAMEERGFAQTRKTIGGRREYWWDGVRLRLPSDDVADAFVHGDDDEADAR